MYCQRHPHVLAAIRERRRMAKAGIDWMISVCSRPAMYGLNPTFESVCALIQGYDAGRGDSVLDRFKMWLILEDGSRKLYNLQWSGLVLRRLFPDKTCLAVLSAEENERCIAELGRCLELYSEDLEFGEGVLYFRFLKFLMKSRNDGRGIREQVSLCEDRRNRRNGSANVS